MNDKKEVMQIDAGQTRPERTPPVAPPPASASAGGDVELPKSLGHIVHTNYGPLYQEVRVEGSTLPSDEVCAISAAIAYAERRVAAYISSLPADWHADSSLETWFSHTAQDVAAKRRRICDLAEAYYAEAKRADSLAARVAELETKLSAIKGIFQWIDPQRDTTENNNG